MPGNSSPSLKQGSNFPVWCVQNQYYPVQLCLPIGLWSGSVCGTNLRLAWTQEQIWKRSWKKRWYTQSWKFLFVGVAVLNFNLPSVMSNQRVLLTWAPLELRWRWYAQAKIVIVSTNGYLKFYFSWWCSQGQYTIYNAFLQSSDIEGWLCSRVSSDENFAFTYRLSTIPTSVFHQKIRFTYLSIIDGKNFVFSSNPRKFWGMLKKVFNCP